MRLGLRVFEDIYSADDVARVISVMEECGVDSFWRGEHTHMPVDTVHHYNTGKHRGVVADHNSADGEVPDHYKRLANPYVVLTAAAMVSKRIRLGTLVALPSEHNPLSLSKEIATLDNVSDGRFEFGVGYGWNVKELVNNGVDPKRRWSTLREHILAMQSCWTQDEAEYHGEYVSFTPSWMYPKPVQTPHPPVLIGGAGKESTFRHVIEFANGWIPATAFYEDLPASVALLHRMAQDVGRDPASIDITVSDPGLYLRDELTLAEWVNYIPNPEVLDTYAAAGVRRLILSVPSDPEIYEPAMEHIAALVKRMADLAD